MESPPPPHGTHALLRTVLAPLHPWLTFVQEQQQQARINCAAGEQVSTHSHQALVFLQLASGLAQGLMWLFIHI
ncbi:hypothetical protein PAMP_021194 [Pampus punctatissimus]